MNVQDAKISKRTQNREQMRQRIKHGATLVFLDTLANEASVTDIVKAADVAEKTFYNHYPTKQCLLEEMAGDMIALCNRLIADAIEPEHDFSAALKAAFVALAEQMQHYPVLAKGLVNFILSLSSNDQLTIAPITFTPVFELGQKAELLDTYYSRAFLEMMVSGACYTVILHWTHNSDVDLLMEIGQAAEFIAAAVCVA
jgi:AcrR family transcriptional regulator